MVAAVITRLWTVTFISILSSLSSGLPATGPISNEIAAIKAEDAIVNSEGRSFRSWKFMSGALQQEETSSAFHFGDVPKLSQDCTVETCVPGHSAKSTPNVDTPCICIDGVDVRYNTLSQASKDTETNGGLTTLGSERRLKRENPSINITYVPPPQTDITPDLLAESLAVQPQNTATIGSITPQFLTGVISYGVQLNGLVAATMTLNASTSLPCDTIGTSPEPNLVLIPADVNNATAKPVILDCEIIAVNMYDPDVVQYWVQKHDGSIYSLAGSNKVQNIGATNTTAGVSLVLRVQLPNQSKRSEDHICSADCPHMITKRALARRAISPTDMHTSSFSEEACAAISCNNNGGKPSLFNPFTRTCGCADPVLVEIDHSGT